MHLYQNGDLCPCCRKPLHDKSEEELRLFSLLVDILDLGRLEVREPDEPAAGVAPVAIGFALGSGEDHGENTVL